MRVLAKHNLLIDAIIWRLQIVDLAYSPQRSDYATFSDSLDSYSGDVIVKGFSVRVRWDTPQFRRRTTFNSAHVLPPAPSNTSRPLGTAEVPIDFSWRAFPTVEEEIAQKLKLQVQLKQEETEEQLFYQQARSEEALRPPPNR